jgi:hypothetical protein
VRVNSKGKTFDTEIYFNLAGVKSRISRNTSLEQKYLDSQVIKDSAQFVPRLTGALERSGIQATKIGSGLVMYNMPYSRIQYRGNFRHTILFHPRASRVWFEVAKAEYKQSWINGVRRLASRR